MFHRASTRIVYWPFALPDAMCASADQWLRNNLDLLGVDYHLDTWQSLSDHDPVELEPDRVDVLFVGGGNTFRLLDQIGRHGFVDHVRRFWLEGGDYYGGSAGAVLACESIEIADGHDPNEAGLEDLAAIGLIIGTAVLPHFTEDQLEAAGRWASSHGTVVLGLPESVGLRCDEGIATVIGRGQLTRLSDQSVERFPVDSELNLPMR
jgi:dipeptidase E